MKKRLELIVEMGSLTESEMDILIADVLSDNSFGSVLDSKEYIINDNIATIVVDAELNKPINESLIDKYLMDEMCAKGAEMIDSKPYINI